MAEPITVKKQRRNGEEQAIYGLDDHSELYAWQAIESADGEMVRSQIAGLGFAIHTPFLP